VVIKLGFMAKIVGFDIDTAHFDGNHAPVASVEACYSPKFDPKHGDNTEWFEILEKVPLDPSSQHFFSIQSSPTFTHVRLNIYPDGGVARFRVYGIVNTQWPRDPTALIDLAYLGHGAKSVACSDQHFSRVDNLLLPGRGTDMSDGWETKRNREKGHCDFAVIKLGAPGFLEKAEIDTAFYKGNYPESASLEACYSDSDIPNEKDTMWVTVLKKSKLYPHKQHLFQLLCTDQKFSHVRLTIYPDGGLKRLRIFGRRQLPALTSLQSSSTKTTTPPAIIYQTLPELFAKL
ncbi:6858_t:CDS:2, partial [Cetraspora pellucida]